MTCFFIDVFFMNLLVPTRALSLGRAGSPRHAAGGRNSQIGSRGFTSGGMQPAAVAGPCGCVPPILKIKGETK